LHCDARQVVEEVHRDTLSPRQRMVCGQHDDDLLVEEMDNLESLSLERPAQKRHVESTCAESGNWLDGVLAVQDQPEVGQMRRDKRAQGWKDANIGCRKGPHRQVASAAAGCLLRQTSRMIEASQDVFR